MAVYVFEPFITIKIIYLEVILIDLILIKELILKREIFSLKLFICLIIYRKFLGAGRPHTTAVFDSNR